MMKIFLESKISTNIYITQSGIIYISGFVNVNLSSYCGLMGPVFSRETSASGLPHSPGVLQCPAATTLAGLQEEEAA